MNSKVFLITLMFSFFGTLTSGAEDIYDFNVLEIKSNNEVYILDSEWYISPEDKNYIENESNWYLTRFDGPWQMLVPELSEYYGNSWYKILFTIYDDSIDNIGVLLPLSYGEYQVYLNDIMIFETKPFVSEDLKMTMFGSKPLLLEIPRESLQNEVNKLSFRVSTFSGWGGFLGYVKIGSIKKLQTRWIRNTIRNTGTGAISLFLSIFFFSHFLFRKNENYYILFSGLCFAVGIFILGFNGLWYYLFDRAWAYWVLTFVGGINMYLLPILFIHSFHSIKLGKIAKGFTFFYLILNFFVLIEYFATGQIFYFVKYVYTYFNLSYILLVIYLMFISIRAVRMQLIYSKMMLISVTLLSVSFLYSMLIFATIIKRPPLIGEGFFAMVVVFSIVLAKRFAQTHTDLEISHKENVELNKNLEEKVKIRTAELQEKNQEITESIEYAALIQDSILPSQDHLESVFSEHFVIWKPRDIVGGDFYWFYKKKDGFLIALVDCTGHGVPGALLAMTSVTVLNEIVTHINNDNPSVILKELNRIMKSILKQGEKVDLSDDGLEIGLCHYSEKEQLLTYAGSKIRLFHLLEGELIEVRGDKQGIGNKRSQPDYNFTNYEVEVSQDLAFYMTTDGLLHQNGGPKDYSFGWSRFTEQLIRNNGMNMQMLKDSIEKALKEFQGDNDQRDDIALIGFKIAVQ